ncbi:MAG TPA: DUF962 domain-containing protein [Steroidobacteraceae bacterium]|nr:DUF962 domain-containing protein [Steroidobacteraceae bacterium]
MTDSSAPAPREFTTFRDFYPYYLSEHGSRVSRRLHVVGTGLVLLTVLVAVVSRRAEWLWLLPLLGYGPAWIGHFFFEKNRPATFRHPFYSLAGDFVMFRDVILGRIRC